MEFIGWILWTVVAYLALSFATGNRLYIKKGVPVMNATIVQTFFWWVIAIVFLLTDWNKLHILWLVPVAYFLGQAIGIGGIPVVSPIVLKFSHVFATINFVGIKPPRKEVADTKNDKGEN